MACTRASLVDQSFEVLGINFNDRVNEEEAAVMDVKGRQIPEHREPLLEISLKRVLAEYLEEAGLLAQEFEVKVEC